MNSNGFPAAPSRRSVTPGGIASIVLVLVAGLVLLYLLHRTESNAVEIRDEAADIAQSGRGINDYTDSIMQLNRTNNLAASILDSARPLDGSLTAINALAGNIDDEVASIEDNAASIDTSARSINSSAASILDDVTTINRTAATINDTAAGVNANAASILDTAGAIERGTSLINSNAATTASIVRTILGDARGIETAAVRTNHLAHCIDNGLNGGSPC